MFFPWVLPLIDSSHAHPCFYRKSKMFLSLSPKHILGLNTQSPQNFLKCILIHGLLKFSDSYFCMTEVKCFKFYFNVHYWSFKTQFKPHALPKAFPNCSGQSQYFSIQLSICYIIMLFEIVHIVCFFKKKFSCYLFPMVVLFYIILFYILYCFIFVAL